MNRSTLRFLGCMGVLAAACVVDVSHLTYEGCKAGDACPGVTSCQVAMYTVTSAPGYLCTVGCTPTGALCPVSPHNSYQSTCIFSVSAGRGLCYDTCRLQSDCGIGMRCALVAGYTAGLVCIPNT